MEVFLKEPRSKQEETIPILDFRNDGKKVIHKHTCSICSKIGYDGVIVINIQHS